MATTQENIAKAQADAERIKAQVAATKAKIEAAKAKIEEAKAKVQATIDKLNKAKALAQSITDSYKAGGIKGGISALIASQVGTIRAKLITEVNTRVDEAINKFISQCPPEKELQRIIRTKNNLKKAVTGLDNRVSAFQPVATNLNTAASLIQLSIEVITSIPIPTAVIPPQTGGVGIPVSTLTKYSNSLVKLNTQLNTIQQESKAITSVVDSVAGVTQGLRNKLDSVDAYIERCFLNNLTTSDDIDAALATIQPKGNTGSEGTPNANYEYKGYTLAIIEDPNSPPVAPKRYAIAKDRRGIVVLQGPSSFSADTQVLLDEIKFRIDNQLA